MADNKPRRAKLLTNLRIDEISAVDRGAGEGCRVVLAKRYDRNGFAQLMDEIFGVRKRAPFNPRWEKNLDVALDPDGDINPRGAKEPVFPPPDDPDDETTDDDDEDERLRDAMKGQTMLDPMKKLESLDAVQICKAIVAEDRAFSISENDLVGLIDRYAKQHGTTFAKLFAAKDDVGLALRKAVSIAKHAGWISQTATMSKAAASGGAYEQLKKLADARRKVDPTLSESQAFAKVFSDPANRDLAAQERAENRPA